MNKADFPMRWVDCLNHDGIFAAGAVTAPSGDGLTLGRGSLVRFCHRHLPHSHADGGGIQPPWWRCDEFQAAPDGDRLTVLLAEQRRLRAMPAPTHA
ncbi:MAG: hypothetical protein IPO19_22900 [Rhodoferax sp.]|nr:hypothetical protein [Rhodoferax sp.]